MEMSNEEIYRSYKHAENQNAQIGILAERNVCKKEEIVKILEEGGIEVVKRGRRKKATQEQKNETKLPDVVQRAISKEMCAQQDLIDEAATAVKERKEALRVAEETLRKYEDELETLGQYLG